MRSGYNIGCIMIMDMTTILLKTKLDIPPARSKQVSRPRLFERLDAGVQRKMTLISAPAGSGKTTLISSWVRERAISTAWFSVDKDDNDPARFWIYFAAGLQTVEGSLGREIQSVLSSSQSPSYNALLTGLINEIGGIKGQLVLVLDDFHLIENDQIQQTMMFFYDYLPPTLHVILSTRADPPWPLARMRAKGEMTELRNDDLCFTFEEAGEFLSETMGIALPHQSVAALREKMEGWIAGLQIAVLSMQNLEEKTGFIETFTGSHRFILDYLLEEVLENQPQETVQFLLKTSVLDRMTAALCDAVTGKSNSQLVLIQLEKANLFLVALDDERRWYRYHHIFSGILRLRLQQLLPNEIAGIYQMASEWCERQNLLTEAIKYALEANDFDRAAYLIEANAFEMFRQAQLSTVVAWMKSLSDDIIQSRPWLSIAYAWVLAYSGHLAGIETIISRVETALVGVDPEKDKPDLVSNKNHLTGHIAAIRGYYALLYARDAVTAIQQSRKALAMLPEDDLRTRGFAKFVECVGLGVGGNLKKSESAFYEAINSEPACQDIFRKITLLSELAQVLRARGLLHRSSATCQHALQLADDYTQQSGRILLKVGFTYSYLSSVLQEWNQNENAAQYALKAVEYGERWGEIDCLILGYQRLAPALLAIGKIKEAFHAIYKAKQAVQNLSGGYKNITTTVETELYLLLGNVEQAAKCFNEIELDIEDEITFERINEYRTYAKLLFAQKKFNDALELIKRILPVEERAGSMNGFIEVLVLQALSFNATGMNCAAINSLSQALDLAEPEGYIRTFIEAGEAARALLHQLPPPRRESDYVKKLLDALEVDLSRINQSITLTSPIRMSQLPGPVDKLTRREIDVLSCLTTSQSIENIADELCISVSTLRTHIRSIYDKLGVHSRMEAATIARGMKLQ